MEAADYSEEEAPRRDDLEVINPSKSKYDKFVESVKQRETLQKPGFEQIPVDSLCELDSNVRVYTDYSVKLIHQELEFTSEKN